MLHCTMPCFLPVLTDTWKAQARGQREKEADWLQFDILLMVEVGGSPIQALTYQAVRFPASRGKECHSQYRHRWVAYCDCYKRRGAVVVEQVLIMAVLEKVLVRAGLQMLSALLAVIMCAQIVSF